MITTVQTGNVHKLMVPEKNEKEQILYYIYLDEIFDIVQKMQEYLALEMQPDIQSL